MKIHYLLTALSLSLSATAQTLPGMPYHPSPKRPVIDTYFGKAVTDNYRWLEDMNSTETKDWFKAQADYSNATLDKIPGRDALIRTFEQYDAFKSANIGAVLSRGGHYFYRKTLPAEKVGKIYYRASLTATEQLLFDPVAYEKTKTYSVSGFTPSEDGKLLAIGLEEGGAEVSTVRVLDVASKTFRPESITGIQGGSVKWTLDSEGFLYSPLNSLNVKDPTARIDVHARYHRLGAIPDNDAELLSRSKYPALGIQPNQTPFVGYDFPFNHLYGFLSTVDRRISAVIAPASDLKKPTIGWKSFLVPEDSVYSFVTTGGKLFLHSIKGAPRGRILVTDSQQQDVKRATELLPEGDKNIVRLAVSHDYVFVTLNDGINDQIRQYDVRTGKWGDVPLPLMGTANLIPLNQLDTDNACQLIVSSWKQPSTRYQYDPASRKTTLSPFHIAVTYPGIEDIVVEEVEVPSHDGRSGVPVMVPLSIIYKKRIKKDGSTVCLLEGYGAYGSSQTPSFSPLRLAVLNQGIICAVAHVRGGGEKGQSWQRGGFKTTKPNTWKDFIACGEYLVKNKYTSPAHLTGWGTSAGGILIGRAITERPDLFAAAINNVGVTSMLRAETMPSGPANIPEYGTVKDSVEFTALYEMDALHHVQDGVKYPAVIGVGGWNDPRVSVWQPGKFAAALQNATSSGKPVLMQVNYDNGHFTEDKAVTFRNLANMFAFAFWQAGHPDFQPSVAERKN